MPIIYPYCVIVKLYRSIVPQYLAVLPAGGAIALICLIKYNVLIGVKVGIGYPFRSLPLIVGRFIINGDSLSRGEIERQL